ncbi:flagellar hook-length control protein FliK, partial [Duganella sp. LX20W]
AAAEPRTQASEALAASRAAASTPLVAAPVAAAVRAAGQPVTLAATGPRSTERTAGRGADNGAAASTAPGQVMASAKDDGVTAVARAEPAPAAVNGNYAPANPAPAATDSVKLAGSPEQWQQPLREALGDRLQLQLQRNDEHAVIRLEPPNMGRVEISIRHTAGALQVNLSANNSEVLRQLNSIGDSVRQDLSQRQFADVAVTVSPSPRGMLAGGDGSGRGQQGQQDDARTPGRALSDDSDAATSFAMATERE